MFKNQLVSTGIILALLGSNIIIGNSYIVDSKEYKRKITQQNEIIKSSRRTSEEHIRNKSLEIKVLHEQLDKLKQEKEFVEKELASRGEKANTRMYFEVSAYTSGKESTGKTPRDNSYGITTSGEKAREGVTVACPPSLPFGTKLNIESVGLRICQDRGGKIKSGKLDLYIESLNKALLFGRKTLLVEILN